MIPLHILTFMLISWVGGHTIARIGLKIDLPLPYIAFWGVIFGVLSPKIATLILNVFI